MFVLLFAWFVFYLPDYLGHADNYIEANPLSTPPHIVPEWYFLPYYAILRAIPDKLLGVIAMFSSILLLVFIPWLDTSRVRSAKYRPIYKWFFWMFVVSVVALGYLGSKPPEGLCRLGPLLHGLLLPASSGDPAHRGRDRESRPLPRSITEVGAGQGRQPAGAPAREAWQVIGLRSQGSRGGARRQPWARALRPGRPTERRRTSSARSGPSRACSASSMRPSCSAGSGSTRRSAPAATASSACRSATWCSPAARRSRRPV